MNDPIPFTQMIASIQGFMQASPGAGQVNDRPGGAAPWSRPDGPNTLWEIDLVSSEQKVDCIPGSRLAFTMRRDTALQIEGWSPYANSESSIEAWLDAKDGMTLALEEIGYAGLGFEVVGPPRMVVDQTRQRSSLNQGDTAVLCWYVRLTINVTDFYPVQTS